MAKSILDKYKSIDQTKISKEAKTILLKIKVKTRNFKETTPDTNRVFNTFYSKLQESKPQAIKGYKAPSKATPKPTTKTSSKGTSAAELLKQAKKNRANQGISTSKSDIEKDAVRPAKPKGYRITDGTNYPYIKGNKYWEGRDNRLDRKQPPKKYPKLEHGGMMAKGGKVENFEIVVVSKELDKDGSRVTKDRFLVSANNVDEAKEMATNLWKEQYGEGTDLSIIGVYSDIDYRMKYMKMADGGMMAEGGNVVKNVMWKQEWTDTKGVDGFDILKVIDTDYFSTNYRGGKVVKSEIVESSKPERVGKMQEDSKQELRKIFAGKYPFAYKMEHGGYMASGGKTEGVKWHKYENNVYEAELGNCDIRISPDTQKGYWSVYVKEGKKSIGQAHEVYGIDNAKDKAYSIVRSQYMAKGGEIDVEDIKNKIYGYFKAWLGNQISDEELVNSLKRKLGTKYFRFFKGDTMVSDWRSIENSLKSRNNRDFLKENMEISLEENSLEIYNSKNEKLEHGGYMAKGGMVEHGLKEGDLIVFESLSEDKSIEVTNKYDGKRYIVNLNEGKREELKSKSKMAHGGTIGEPHRMEIGQ